MLPNFFSDPEIVHMDQHEVVLFDTYAVVQMARHSFMDDLEDLARVVQHRWCFHKHRHTNYVRRNDYESNKTWLLHRFIMEPEEGMVVDHINGDGLDCRRHNMRLATSSQNSVNSKKSFGRRAKSRYKGVARNKKCGMWTAQISVNGCPKYLGQFDSEEAAAQVYDAKMYEIHGDFARLNFSKVRSWAIQYLKSKQPRIPSSKFRGVYRVVYEKTTPPSKVGRPRSLHSPKIKWRAVIVVEGKRVNLGYFESEEEAGLAIDIAKSK